MDEAGQIAAIRAFNRFYTRQIGLLDEHMLKSKFSLAEGRVLYEIGSRGKSWQRNWRPTSDSIPPI